METVAHDWADLGNALEMGKKIHATYHREMEATWGPDYITTIPEDYAQHVILGVSLVESDTEFPQPSISLLEPHHLYVIFHLQALHLL